MRPPRLLSATLALYVAVGVAYVALGVIWPNLLLSWVEGTAFLLLGVWILPTVVLRFR